ncbi:hypothetical protein G4X40_19705 [Rhodococcus sp. D2-41]|uniref:hypothetical protein n=1 Tax=Speluncibacter jeojiensis TaxID=2710754 RepID=UPI0024102A98|nr:hypothetical protein [Rhodococcus sp. D2-41]MDG3012369.1 hypothetical protein [Rhodococcus sp. D2-41]
MATYTVNADGSITWNGSVTFSGATDPLSTGVATLTLTPAGGVSNLPALVDGAPGLPPQLTFAVNTLAAGATATVQTTQTNPGSAGTASAYTVTLGIPQGAQGAAGTNATIAGASDLELPSGVSLGTATAGYTLSYDAVNSKWLVGAPKRTTGPYVVLSSSFTAYSGTAGSATLASIGLPALPYAYRPQVQAGFYGTGTVNTHVDGMVLLNSPTPGTGQQVGYGLGITGAGPYPVNVQTSFGASISGSSTYGQVAANTAATFYLVASQLNSTTDSWGAQTTNGYLTITAVPS